MQRGNCKFFFVLVVIALKKAYGDEKPYGSSNFGTWVTDPYGQPAYKFTGALEKPGRIRPTVPMIAHRVGNDRIEAAVLTNGEVSFRQDEGCPKLLNDYDGEHGQFRGGIGYLADYDTHEVLSTRAVDSLSPEIDNFSLLFGINYVQKSTWNKDLAMEHRLFSPFGDLPMLYSQVNITNLSKVKKNISYVEYWGGKIHLLNCRHKPPASFNHSFSFSEEMSGLQDTVTLFSPNKTVSTAPEPSYYDSHPRPVYLYSLNKNPPSSYTTNGKKLFPTADATSPNILYGLDNDTSVRDDRGIMALQETILLDSSDTISLCFVYGYTPTSSFDIKNFLGVKDCSGIFSESVEQWKSVAPLVNLPGELDWVQRELTWHTYMLRSALTFDRYKILTFLS